MYLKEISMTGFKSFADKIAITLDGKTTCIVGPNGSGKSNVVDAVRWVLGEQSIKSLRGENNMSDVIFSGSKSRKASNVASVSLTFDNTDGYVKLPYQELTIKRRVYRTGDNEYFINNEKCRLKDITDLFLDTGIGKNSFNIISQGEVQKILSESSYDRRVIFESAAEVLKYKKRKEEALKKLDRTHQNLERVNDIIGELESQLSPLKEQSRKAREYLEIKTSLEQVEVALLADDIQQINQEYQHQKDNQEKFEQDMLNLSLENNQLDTSIASVKNDLLKKEEEIKSVREEILLLTQKQEQIHGDKKLLEERRHYDASDHKIHDHIAFLREEELKKANEHHALADLLQDNQKQLEITNDDVNKKSLELSTLEKKLQAQESEKEEKRMSLLEEKHKIGLLTEYIEQGGTTSSSIKAILNHPRLRGIHQTLGNLIQVEHPYIKAIDISLAASKQFLVVENEESAKSCIEYLKEQKLGRATFFPLNVIKPRGIDLETLTILQKDHGYVSLLCDVVAYDKKYHNIVMNQLGNVILAKDIDSANRISRTINQRYKVVTLDGDIVHVGGTITGGSVANSKSVFTEKKELEFLKHHQVELTEVIAHLDKQIEELRGHIKQLEQQRKDLEIEQFRLKEIDKMNHEAMDKLQKEEEEITRQLNSLENVVDSSLSKEEEKITKSYYDVSRNLDDAKRQLNSIEKEISLLHQKKDQLDADCRLNYAKYREIEKTVKHTELALSKMEIQLDQNLQVLSEEYEMTYEKAISTYSLDMDKEEAREKVIFYKARIKEIGMVNLQAIEDCQTVCERYEFLTSQKEDLLNAQDTLLEIIDEMDQVMKEEFSQTFNRIREEFEKVFKELFAGGSATLTLTDPANILETGVDIVASPPGKKLTSINLLSGGEKTLTAICLIFAILNVKAVPFCLFDEVEAALDEANVDRFGKYLDHYKEKTQFLIITHKKKTMEYAKTLYGITMQESGVSKLVSVKLDSIS